MTRNDEHGAVMRRSLAEVWIFVGIFLAAFAFELRVSQFWYERGLFDEFNVLFDTDPITQFRYFADSSTGTLRHPYLGYIFSVPIRLVQKFGSAAGLVNDAAEFRLFLALLVAPICAGIKCSFFFLTLRALGVSLFCSVWAGLFALFSFSTVIMGTVPESFIVTGATISVLIYLSVSNMSASTRVRSAFWFMCGAVSIGTTLTNVGHLFFALVARHCRNGRNLLRSVSRSLVFSTVCLVFVLVSFPVVDVLNAGGFGFQEHSRSTVAFVTAHGQSLGSTLLNLLAFPEIAMRGVFPTIPAIRENALAIAVGGTYDYMFTFEQETRIVSRLVSYAVFFGVVISGFIRALMIGGGWRIISLSASGALASLAVFYSWFGSESFLYSENWNFYILLISASWLTLPFFETTSGRVVLGLVLTALVAGDIFVLASIIDVLDTGK